MCSESPVAWLPSTILKLWKSQILLWKITDSLVVLKTAASLEKNGVYPSEITSCLVAFQSLELRVSICRNHGCLVAFKTAVFGEKKTGYIRPKSPVAWLLSKVWNLEFPSVEIMVAWLLSKPRF